MYTSPACGRTRLVTDLSRRERRKVEIRGRILDAAEHLFLEQGVKTTKVAEICARADVAHQTFFNHFPSKQHVIRELATNGVEELLGQIESARKEGTSTRDRLLRFFDQVAESSVASAPMHREFLTEIIHATYELGEESEQARRLRHAFGAVVADGLAAGDVTRRHSAETLTDTILGAYYVLMFNVAHLGDYPIQKQAKASARFLADALARDPGEE